MGRRKLIIQEEAQVEPGGVKRIVFREWLPGDRKKAKASSNIAPTGGGARDLRLPYRPFTDVMSRMFTERRRVRRRRNDKTISVDVRVGRLFWHDHERNVCLSAEAVFEPPTSARPTEGRIATINRYPPFSQAPPEAEGRAIILLVQTENDMVWPAFPSEHSLRNEGWNEQVANFVLECLDCKRPKGHAACGYLDLERDEKFCNGR